MLKKTGVPVITAIQKNKELHPWQVDILESLKIVENSSFILSLSKRRPVSGDSVTIKMDYNGKRLIPLK
jgi:hypothetical protein